MGLSVRASRCAAISMIIFGFLIFIPASAYIVFSIVFGHAIDPILTKPKGTSLMEFMMVLSWHLGYTSLLALITMITGCIGCCASDQRAHRDMCQIVTLFIFSLIVAGLSTYTIYDFSNIISVAKESANRDRCTEGVCWLIIRSVEGTLLGLAILVLLLSSWAVICCIASCCCHTEVEPELVSTQQQMSESQHWVTMPMTSTDAMPVMLPPDPAMAQVITTSPANQVAQPQIQAMPRIA